MLLYLLKANLLMAALYALYRLLLQRDTFFAWRRGMLLGIVILSLLAPLPALHGWGTDVLPTPVARTFNADVWLPEVIVNPQLPENSGQTGFWVHALWLAYAAGVVLLAGRMLVQLLALMRLARRCPSQAIGPTHIRQLPQGHAPFSFFHWIFVCPQAHKPEELDEILAHEATHARQGHFIDVLVAEVACIVCWFNPAAWLLKREIRNNLEYLADRHVLAEGHDARTYQYHLLGLAYHKAAANLYNNFNVSPLKQRIKMMNKRNTHTLGKLKYLLFIPAAVLLAAACNGQKEPGGVMVERGQDGKLKTTVIDQETMDKIAEQAEKADKVAKGDPDVYDMVETPPEFPGGSKAMMEYLKNNIKYPEDAKAAKKEGRVIAQFVVTSEGKIGDVTILRGVLPSLDEEAIRVIKAMPAWTPGKQDGEAVSVRFTIPIIFRLQ